MSSATSTVAPVLAAPPARISRLTLPLLCTAHFFIDLYASSLSALQPLLVERLGLTLAQAGFAAGLLLVSSSVMQPLYGYLADRFHSRLFTVLAPAVAGVFLMLLATAPGYPSLLALAVLGGAGVASFHPQASVRAGEGVSANKGRWMAIFISSGTLGMALGPTGFSWVIVHFGVERLPYVMSGGILLTVLLFRFLPETPPSSSRGRGIDWVALRMVWKPLLILYLCVFIRSIVQIVYAQFLPLYLNRERGFSYTSANGMLTLYLAAGAFGGFAGGWLSDRLGGRRVIMISMLGCVPPLALFFHSSGVLAAGALALGGLVLLFTTPVNLVLAQELVPSQTGTVSALMMGFAWGAAGFLFVPAAGAAADHFTLHRVMYALLAFPIAGFLLARLLPERGRRAA